MSNVTVKKTGTPTISVIEDERGVCVFILFLFIYMYILIPTTLLSILILPLMGM